jgi:ubiquinone/menaquinone biosynthesis C-methylase UbiE
MSANEQHNDYDAFAAGYSADNESNATNAYYERPASLALLGEVAGQHVLDAGCGAGAHAAELIRSGATVTGLDKSAGLIGIARQRLGGNVPLHEADLADPLPFQSASFDAVLASLVLHYLQDWGPTLAEFRRVLVPGGRLVISTHHPFMDHTLAGWPDYFATYDFTEEWTKGGQTVLMRFWHRPLRAMTGAFQAAGFALDTISEPDPDPAAENLFPAVYADLRTNPRFLFFRLTAP